MKKLLLTIFVLGSVSAQAQTSSDFLQAMKKAEVDIVFDVTASGKEHKVNWGMDAAWDWDYNVYRGIGHIGKGNFATGRVSFQPIDLVTDNGDGTYTLTARQQKKLKVRCDLIKLTGTKEVNLNCDHEALFCKVDADGNYPEEVKADGKTDKITDYTGRSNYQGKPEEWYKLIKASVAYVEKQGLKVVSVSPFNEPDNVWEQAKTEEQAMADFLEIAKLLKADDYFKDIRICGGNTLNDDKALTWYNYLYDYIDEGNTHQLAGDFDHYAQFFTKVKADGKVGTADELHNVGEAIVGANYGMENGIWWGFDSKARGQFCIDSNEGVQIGYGENRDAWTNGAVYRNEVTGEVHGYIGSSERQARTSNFAFVSKGKDVYFNGYGPTRIYVYDVPADEKGTYSMHGGKQIGAERLFDITWGEDVAPFEVDGTYQVMNMYSKNLLTMNSGNATVSTRKTTGTTQQWKVYPGYTTGDISYWFFDNAGNTNMHLNSELTWGNLATIFTSNANVVVYNNSTSHPMEEQWYVKYAQDGAYFIINRLTNNYLYCGSTTNGAMVSSKKAPASNASKSELKKYLWRFQPIDSKAETKAPNAPTDLTAKQRIGSIELSWTAPVDSDPLTYTILRAEASTSDDTVAEYNTIGRGVTLTQFVDNAAIAGKEYLYKVIAVDYAGNRSEASEPLHAKPLNEKALLCQLQFDGKTKDISANQYNASIYGSASYSSVSTFVKSGSQSLNLTNSTYAMLPYAVAHQDEMTIATWVRWSLDTKTTSLNNWQRVFDFGNGTTQYMFFTPSTGSEMRFVMKNEGDEQILTNGKKLGANAWHHIAITLKPVGEKVQAALYIDGEAIAESNDFTIRPSDIAPSLCYIGRSMFASDPMFNGRLDDFRIYNYALTSEEIAAVMTDIGEESKDINDTYEEAVSTSINALQQTTNDRTNDHQLYDLNGRPTHASDKGILIQKGKKILKK